ncbi:DUF3093 domain-containing protein [Agrococcus citreus]|uniref:DUF3093 domain-containing protein n=1 Tax=Agrococcus citreus TaxID=84643 RepID=A0ABP4JEJ9_9MICO
MNPAHSYRERLVPPWWMLLLLLLIVPAALLVFLPVDLRVGAAVAVGLYAIIVAVLWLGAPVVEVQAGMLRAGRARIDVVHLGAADALQGADATAALRADWNPGDHHVISPWTKSVVRVAVEDPSDPTGAWVISSRRPEQLASAIRDARSVASGA